MQPFLTAARSLRSAFAGRFFPLVALVAVLAGISLATRMVLMARADSVLPSGAGPLLKIFGIGLYFDLVAAVPRGDYPAFARSEASRGRAATAWTRCRCSVPWRRGHKFEKTVLPMM